MNSIADIFRNSKQLLDSIDHFFDKYIGCSLLRKCGISKMVDTVTKDTAYQYCDNPIFRLIGNFEKSKVLEKCISAKKILQDKLTSSFYSMSVYFMFKENIFTDYKKDTFYRFDRMPKANWERLQLETAYNVIIDIEDQMSDKHINALVFDDSLYQRRSGKGTELCARVYDHNDNKTRLGYRMMTGGWTNGDVFIPFAQALLSTRDESQMVGPDEKIDHRTIRGKRRARAKQKGTEVVQAMVRTALETGIPFDYVLFDTWFSSPSQLLDLKDINVDTIAMIKKSKTKYNWTNPEDGKTYKLDTKEIYSRNKKRKGRSKYLLSVKVEITDSDGRSIPARLVYARNTHNRNEWVCFVCTNMELDEDSILRIYTMRWSIETYFKMCKSYLKLRTECHSTSYDAITSHMVIVSIRYMILAVERFRNTDHRSLEDLFNQVKRELLADLMDKAIILIIDVLLDSVQRYFKATDTQMEELLNDFIGGLPFEWQERFAIPVNA